LSEWRGRKPKVEYVKSLIYIASKESTLPQLNEILKHLPSISKEKYDTDIANIVKKCLEGEKK
jgi:hypothetical protein